MKFARPQSFSARCAVCHRDAPLTKLIPAKPGVAVVVVCELCFTDRTLDVTDAVRRVPGTQPVMLHVANGPRRDPEEVGS